MADRNILDEDRIQDYIDDRLGERDRANVAAYLLANPEIGAGVEQLRRQNEALKAVGQEILEEPVPERLRSALRPRPTEGHTEANVVTPTAFVRATPRYRFLEAAAALLLFVIGGGAGWFLHSQLNPPLSEDDFLTAQLASAYGFYAAERDYPVDYTVERLADFDAWINRSFKHSVPPPDLASFRYSFAGGRRVPTASAPVGLFEFENDDQQRVSVFFWPKNAQARSMPKWTDNDSSSIKIWVQGDLNLAVVTDKATPDFDGISNSVDQFYRQALATE